MKNLLITLTLLLLAAFVWAATAPVVSNIVMTERTDGSKLVDITYNLADAENNASTISLRISAYGDTIFTIIPTPANLNGAVGPGITVGTGKAIVWNIGAESYILNKADYHVMVTADDGTTQTLPSTFILVNGGTFNNGTSDVTLSSFKIDKYEVTQSSYLAVMGVNPSGFPGVVNGPVERLTWYNAIEYCNRRSISEGLAPCYSYSTYGTNPNDWPLGWNWNTSYNHTNVSCSWTATGYRLPTEAEWQFAARGGNSSLGYTYSGSNTVVNVAWCQTYSDYRTHTVGTKAANELGLCDMSGNVHEWCWDIYSSTYPSGAQTNPHGADSGNSRVYRGGDWVFSATWCAVAARNWINPWYYTNARGFRVVRLP